MSRLIVAVLCVVLPLVPATAQTVNEIVAKTLAARGGVEKLRSLQTVKTTVKMQGPEGKDITVTDWMKRPNKMRRDTEFPDRTLTVATDGTIVWTADSAAGLSQRVQGPESEMMRERSVGFDPPFLDYKERGDRLELVGPATVDGKPAHHLRLTKKNGRVEQHYVSADDGRPLRTVATFEQAGMKAEVRTDFSDYQSVDGMLVPFTITQSIGGKPAGRVRVEKIEFNVPIDDEFFKMVEK